MSSSKSAVKTSVAKPPPAPPQADPAQQVASLLGIEPEALRRVMHVATHRQSLAGHTLRPDNLGDLLYALLAQHAAELGLMQFMSRRVRIEQPPRMPRHPITSAIRKPQFLSDEQELAQRKLLRRRAARETLDRHKQLAHAESGPAPLGAFAPPSPRDLEQQEYKLRREEQIRRDAYGSGAQ